MSSRPVKPRATRIAAVVASVPDEQKRIFSTQGIRARTSSASWISRGDGAPKEEPSFIASCTSRITSGWQWPTIIGPQLRT